MTTALCLGAVLLGEAPPAASASRPAATFSKTRLAIGSPKGNLGREETSVAIDPTDPNHIVVGANDRNYGKVRPDGYQSLGLFNSTDGGKTWHDRKLVDLVPLAGQGAAGADPSATFDRYGTAYFTGLASGAVTRGVFVTKSSDGGTTWTKPIYAAKEIFKSSGTCYGADKEYITSDPRTGKLYIVYTRARVDCERYQTTGVPLGAFSPIVMITSTDHGVHWTKPKVISDSADADGLGAVPVIGPDGTLYVAYMEERSTPNPLCSSTRSLFFGKLTGTQMTVATSRNGGSTWSYRRMSGFCSHNYNYNLDQPLILTDSLPSMSVDPTTGRVFLAWANHDLPLSTIHIVSSIDHGATWKPAGKIADTAAATYLPWLSANGGVLRMVYESVAPLMQYIASYRESFDGGKTWTNPHQLDIDATCAGCPAPDGESETAGLGDYWGLDARCGLIVPAWADRHGPTGVSNIYTRIGHYPSTEPCAKSLRP